MEGGVGVTPAPGCLQLFIPIPDFLVMLLLWHLPLCTFLFHLCFPRSDVFCNHSETFSSLPPQITFLTPVTHST